MKRFRWLCLASALGLVLWVGRSAPAQDYFVPPPKDNVPPTDEEPLPPEISNIADVEAKLKVIQRRSQLIIGKSNVVRTAVADPSIVDVVQFSPNEIAVIGMSVGSTTLTFWFENNPDPLVYLAEVIRDPSLEDRQRTDYGKLERKLAVMFPNSKVYLIPLSGKLIIKGQARDAEEAANILQIVRGEAINQSGSLAGPQPIDFNANNIIGANGTTALNAQDLASSFIVNMMTVPGEFQIALKVQIAELRREQLRRMGLDFNFLLNDRQFFNSVTGGGGGNLTGVFEAGDISVLLNWLASNGTAKVLARPNITVLSGHTASFLSGGEFPVPTIVGIDGAAGQQTSFRGFGVSLFATPTVIGKDTIRMQITPEFSEINAGNGANGVPGTNVRRVSTTIDVREGQTLALAGLLDSQQRMEVTRVPFLGEIPYLGTMFNAKQATLDESELLILVTPELVRPMEPDEVPPVPGHEVTHPNDVDLYWYNRTEGNPDQGVYQLAPYGHNGGQGQEVGYTQYNPAPYQPNYQPGFGQGPMPSPVLNGGLPSPLPSQTPNLAPVPQYQNPYQYGAPPMGNRFPASPAMRPTSPVPQQPLGRLGPTQAVPTRQPTPAAYMPPRGTQATGPRLGYPQNVQRTSWTFPYYTPPPRRATRGERVHSRRL